eukprot:COSAG01_NODE_8247_length_2858_cov_1.254078_3_plen_73_part_00
MRERRGELTRAAGAVTDHDEQVSFHPGFSPLEPLDDGALEELGAVAEWTEGSDLIGAEVNEQQAEWAPTATN